MQNDLPVTMLLADGSRRWASERGLTIEDGYIRSSILLAKMFEHLENKVKSLYLPVCTMNNLTKRPAEQVPYYMDCFYNAIVNCNLNIRLELAGDLSAVDKVYRSKFEDLAEKTKGNDGMKIVYLIGWSSDEEVLRICKRVSELKIIDRKSIELLSDIKEPIDLIIRTGRVHRLSAMMPLFSPYAEICFIDALFPDTTVQMLDSALERFYKTERRFGGK